MSLDTEPSKRETAEQPPVEHETDPLPLLMVGVLVVAVGMWGGLPWLLMILGIIVMITIHELGHFLAAKWAGMKATEFFIGFGPKIWSFQRGETEYGLKAIPAGAYVRIIGMNNLDDVPAEDEARSYRQQSFPKRLIVVLAGPATHAVQAFVILMVMLTLVGVPDGEPLGAVVTEAKTWEARTISEDSAASAAGLAPGDRVVGFDGKSIETWGELTDLIRSGEVGKEVTLTIVRDGETFERTTALVERPESAGGDPDHPRPFLGIEATVPDEKFGLLEAIPRSVTETGDVAWQSLVAMGNFFSPEGVSDYANTVSEGSGSSSNDEDSGSVPAGKVSEEEGGNRMLSILGVLRLGADAGEQGLANLLPIFLMINIFVGLLNLVPLLPFDGGHAVVAIYERIRSRDGVRYHADVSKLLPVAYAVVMGLVVLGVTSLYLDIVNPV